MPASLHKYSFETQHCPRYWHKRSESISSMMILNLRPKQTRVCADLFISKDYCYVRVTTGRSMLFPYHVCAFYGWEWNRYSPESRYVGLMNREEHAFLFRFYSGIRPLLPNFMWLSFLFVYSVELTIEKKMTEMCGPEKQISDLTRARLQSK